MQENHPPHSLPEIQVLLSQYLDGTLEPDEQRQLEKLLDEHPLYRQELEKLQSLRGAVRQTSDQQLAFSKVSDGIWQNLARQLQEDRHAELVETDPEFICAYYDNEIPSHDPALKAFESQLYRNTEANRILADMGQISEAVRQFGYRLEASCTLDISQSVMAAYRTELGIGEEPITDTRSELLSAYVDKELSGKELIAATQLIENDPAARHAIQLYTRLSERIQAISEELQQQAPDLWPAVREQFEQEAEVARLSDRKGKVLPFKKALRYAVPASVAAILLILAVPAVHNSGTYTPFSSPMNYDGRIIAEAGNDSMRPAKIASTEGVAEPRLRQASFSEDAVATPMLEPRMDLEEAKPSIMPAEADSSDLPEMKPMLEPMPAAAPAPAAALPKKEANRASHGAPSSDEYLFDALSQQMTNEEILALLGE